MALDSETDPTDANFPDICGCRAQRILKTLSDQQERNINCDATLKCGYETINVHQCVLDANLDTSHLTLCNDASTYIIPNDYADSFSIVVDFLYCRYSILVSKVDNLHCIEELLKFASFMDMKDLHLYSLFLLDKTLDHSTSLDVLGLAEKYQLDYLAEKFMSSILTGKSSLGNEQLSKISLSTLTFLANATVTKTIDFQKCLLSLVLGYLEHSSTDDPTVALSLVSFSGMSKNDIESILFSVTDTKSKLRTHPAVLNIFQQAATKDGLHHLAAVAELLNQSCDVDSDMNEYIESALKKKFISQNVGSISESGCKIKESPRLPRRSHRKRISKRTKSVKMKDAIEGNASEKDIQLTTTTVNEEENISEELEKCDNALDIPAMIKVKYKRGKRAMTDEEMFRCDKCDKVFATPGSLRHHARGHGDEDARHLCSICGFQTKHKCSLAFHMKQHTGTGLHCTYDGCNFTTFHRSRLEDHLSGHLGQKNHVCHICNKAFQGRKHLYRHIKIHTAPKLVCTFCSYKTQRKDKLKEHIKKKHTLVKSSEGIKYRELKSKKSKPPLEAKTPIYIMPYHDDIAPMQLQYMTSSGHDTFQTPHDSAVANEALSKTSNGNELIQANQEAYMLQSLAIDEAIESEASDTDPRTTELSIYDSSLEDTNTNSSCNLEKVHSESRTHHFSSYPLELGEEKLNHKKGSTSRFMLPNMQQIRMATEDNQLIISNSEGSANLIIAHSFD